MSENHIENAAESTVGLKKLLDLLAEPMKQGCRFEIFFDEGVFCVDLNTGAKSGCVLKARGETIKAYRRYGRVDIVDDFDDLLSLVADCGHGRNFFNHAWVNILKSNGFSDPRGNL